MEHKLGDCAISVLNLGVVAGNDHQFGAFAARPAEPIRNGSKRLGRLMAFLLSVKNTGAGGMRLMEQITESTEQLSSISYFGIAGEPVGHSAPLWMQDRRLSLLWVGADATNNLASFDEVRFLGAVSQADAPERLRLVAHVDIIILNGLVAASNPAALFAPIQSLCRDNDTILMVATTVEMLDEEVATWAWAEEEGLSVEWLCDPEASDWEAAFARVKRQKALAHTLQDSGQDGTRAQLQQLSKEVDRLSRTLRTLQFPDNNTNAAADQFDEVVGDEATEYTQSKIEEPLTASIVRTLLRARRQRERFLGDDLFADPAWDMILDLMAARLAGERVSVSSLCIAAAVPPTTALRWIRHLTQRGLFERQPDTQDGRRVFIALSDKAAAAVERWYAWSLRPRLDGYD